MQISLDIGPLTSNCTVTRMPPTVAVKQRLKAMKLRQNLALICAGSAFSIVIKT